MEADSRSHLSVLEEGIKGDGKERSKDLSREGLFHYGFPELKSEMKSFERRDN